MLKRVAVACFLVLALLMSFKAFYVALQGGVVADNAVTSAATNRDNLIYVALWGILYACSAGIMLHRTWTHGLDRRLLWLVPFAAFVVASATWSAVPLASAIPASMLALDIVIAAALASLIHPARLLRTTAGLTIVLMVVSLLLLAAAPGAFVSDPTRPGLLMAGQLVGAYDSKETLGISACITLIILWFLPWLQDRPRIRLAATALLCVCLLLSNSAGAVGASIIAIGTLLAGRLLPRFKTPIFATVVGFSVLLSLSLPFIDIGAVAQLLGRSADFTGRGTFWPLAPGYLMERPFLGYGFLAFFNPGPYSRAWEIWDRELYFFTPEFHNSFLDLLIGLGLVGGLAYIAILLTASCVLLHRTLEPRCAEVLVAILIVFTIGSSTEFLLLAHNSFPTIFLFYCFLLGGRRYAAARRENPPAREAEVPTPSRQGRWRAVA